MIASPRILAVGEEPPPMEPPPSTRPRVEGRDRGRPKGKAAPRTARERFRTLNTFVDFTARTLRRNELLVWLVLYRDTRDGVARTAQADIARRIGASKRTVMRAIHRLTELGLLAVVYRGGLRRGPSAYRVRPLAKDGS
jgi:hypothetical protein